MVTIERATECDMPQVAELLHMLWQDEGSTPSDPASDYVTFRESLVSMLRSYPEMITIYVAREDEYLLRGCIVCTYVEIIRTGMFSGLKTWFAPKGTALALMQAAADRLSEQGAVRAMATTSARGHRGTRRRMTYEGCGLSLESMVITGAMTDVISGLDRRANRGKHS